MSLNKIEDLYCSHCNGQGYITGGKIGNIWYQTCSKCDGTGRRPPSSSERVRIAKGLPRQKGRKSGLTGREFLRSLRQQLMGAVISIDSFLDEDDAD